MLNLDAKKLKTMIKNSNGNIVKVLSLLNISNTDNEEDDIVEILSELGIEARVCSICNKIIINGFIIEDGYEYACTRECLAQLMPLEEFDKISSDPDSSTYETDWVEPDEEGYLRNYSLD